MKALISAVFLGTLSAGLLYRLWRLNEKISDQTLELAVLRLENVTHRSRLREARNLAKDLSRELADEKGARSQAMAALSNVFSRECQRAECMAAQLKKLNRFAMVRAWRRRMCMSSAMSAGGGRFQDDHAWRFLASAALKQVMDDTSALKDAIRRRDRFALAEAAARVSRSAEAFPVIFRYDGNAAFAALHERDMTLDPISRHAASRRQAPDFSRVRGLSVKRDGRNEEARR